jgi:class I lanthipeptide synthase
VNPGPEFALLRTALLGVEESAAMVVEGRCTDPDAAAAVTVAAGPRVVEADTDRSRATLARYLARMGGRATPFGLFAGTAVAGVGDERALVVGPRRDHRALVRVDLEVLRALVQESLDEQPLERTPLRANPTLRRDGAALRFSRPGDATADVVTVRANPAMRELLDAVADGPRPGAELVARLAATRPGTDPGALAGFVRRLVELTALVPAVDLVEPGVEPADLALALLEWMGDTGRAGALRALVDAACGEVPLAGLTGRLAGAWAPAAERVAAWREVAVPHRFHVELRMAAPAAVVDRRTVEDLHATVLRLVGLSSGRHELDEVRDAFRERYEDAEVPLLAALDLESGVARPRLRGASVLAGSAGVRFGDADDPPRLDPRRLELLDRWLRDGDPVDIGHLPLADRSPVRSIQAALLDDHEGRYRSLLVGGAGRSPFALVARFAHGRPGLQRRMVDWLAAEDADADGPPIRAELVYHPAHRIANVLVRPRLLAEQIALGAAPGGTLALDRLLLRVQGDRFALRDAVTGRPVQVELTTAHNVDMAGQDPLYSFLGHLASPGGAAWSWGALERLSHLPRVTCGSVVVAPERWRLPREAVRGLLADPHPAAALRALLPGVGERRWIGTGVYDNVLPIDLRADASAAAALARVLPGLDAVDVLELPQLESPAVTGPHGAQVAEVVLPVRPPRAPARARPVPAAFDPAHAGRWVYFRYHCGYAAADAVVRAAGELADRLRADGLATAWFFLRYSAEGHHVRVRVRAAEGRRDAVVEQLGALGARLRADDAVVSRVVMDDYVPEVARYGGPAGLALAEELFSADSDQVARLVAAGTTEQQRLYRAVAGMVDWCDVLFDDQRAAQEFLAAGAAGQGLSFRTEGNRHGRFHREHRAELERFVAAGTPDAAVGARLAALAAEVRGRLDPDRVGSVLGSALHLHCNRLFTFDANRLEFLAYELARRTLRSRAARRAA